MAIEIRSSSQFAVPVQGEFPRIPLVGVVLPEGVETRVIVEEPWVRLPDHDIVRHLASSINSLESLTQDPMVNQDRLDILQKTSDDLAKIAAERSLQMPLGFPRMIAGLNDPFSIVQRSSAKSESK